mmetsp:Transcript_18883/g.27601  ORF Transcript_18883/g.27601 Transcript_18883/m.27601 type:complete len:123 (-) Transcript_18883:568-936(-)
MGRLLHDFAVFVGNLPATGDAADAFKIGAGEHPDHAGHGGCCGCVDGVDPPMGHIRAQEVHIGLPAQIDIVGVIAVSCQEPDVLAPFWTGADAAFYWATIFWHIQISSLEGADLVAPLGYAV